MNENPSRVEEVLRAILGRGTVTSVLISRVEKILDAIRVEGSYDDPALSEVEEILLCILRGERYEEPTHSRIADMLKVKANGGEYTEPRLSRVEDLIYDWINDVEYATYEGTLPAVLDTKSGYLKSYKIYGDTDGVGAQTDDGYKISITSRIEMWCSELKTVVNPSAPEKRYIKFSVSRDISQGLTISKTGLIYYKGRLSELTVDTSGAVEKVASGTAKTGKYSANIEDTGGGITVVGYVVIDGVYYYSKVYYYTWDYVKEHEPIVFPDPTPVTTDIYIGDEPLGKNEYVDSLSGKIVRIRDVRSELDFSITEPYPTVNSKGVGRVTVVKSISWETGLTIMETGLIYVKDVTNDDDLILENVGIHGIDKKVTPEDTREHTLNVTDPDGNGARIVGYAIVTDGTYETTLYSEEAKATYQQLVDELGQSHLYPGHDDVGGIPDPQNPPVPLPRIPTFDGSTTIVYEGTPAPEKVELVYKI